MKILAISKSMKEVNWEHLTETLEKEALEAYKMYLGEIIREIYFTDDGEAVLILECTNKREARIILQKLPLVKGKIIDFNLFKLMPYNGFSRLMDNNKYAL